MAFVPVPASSKLLNVGVLTAKVTDVPELIRDPATSKLALPPVIPVFAVTAPVAEEMSAP